MSSPNASFRKDANFGTSSKDSSPTRLARIEHRDSTTSTTPTLVSGSSYLTYPVTYSVNGLLRRLSGDTASNTLEPRRTSHTTDMKSSLSKSLSSSLSWSRSSSRSPSGRTNSDKFSGGTSLTNSAYMPAPLGRIHSPFQQPPLTPLTLTGYKDSTTDSAKLLTKAVAEEIRLLVPPRIQLAEEWKLVFSLEQDGVSLATLYQKCEEYRGSREGFVLVVKDSAGGIFGAFLTEAPHPSAHYFGTGECFLWRATILPSIPDLSSLPPPPSADTTNATRMTTLMHTNSDGSSTADRIRFKAFPYSGVNDYMIFCEAGYLSVGGGDGHYGLWLDDNLERGVSSMCLTFGNEPLSDEGTKFDVIGVEIWHLGA